MYKCNHRKQLGSKGTSWLILYSTESYGGIPKRLLSDCHLEYTTFFKPMCGGENREELLAASLPEQHLWIQRGPLWKNRFKNLCFQVGSFYSQTNEVTKWTKTTQFLYMLFINFKTLPKGEWQSLFLPRLLLSPGFSDIPEPWVPDVELLRPNIDLTEPAPANPVFASLLPM
jgi:hypothetical protein